MKPLNIILILVVLCSCNNIIKDKETAKIETVQTSEEQKTLVIRTDFGNDSIWETLCYNIMNPQSELKFTPYVEFISDKKYNALTPEQVQKILPTNYNEAIVFIVDNKTMTQSDNPVVCIDLEVEKGRMFRIIPSEMWGVENNVRIANMDFYEFADQVDEDGIFRGFR